MVSHLKWFVVLGLSFSLLVEARPTFNKKTIHLKNKILTVEVAENDEQRSFGLMQKEKLNKNEGMLFIFDEEAPRSFWMKNTYLDLSIAFFDKNKVIVDIQNMPASTMVQSEFPTYESAKPAKYALEMNKDWFKTNKIKIGDKFSFKKSQ